MLDVLLDTIIDSIKLLPFLMEYLEHKMSDKSKKKIEKSGKIGPLIRKCLRYISTMWLFSCCN